MKQPYEGGSEENVDLNDAGNGEAQDEEMRQEVGEFKDQIEVSDDSDLKPQHDDIVSYPSLDEALDIKFDVNTITSMPQRLRNLNCQPRILKELQPAPFHLLAKREKRCNTCHKIVIKHQMNPGSNEKMKTDYQMVYYVPKVMIYRIGKYTPYKGTT